MSTCESIRNPWYHSSQSPERLVQMFNISLCPSPDPQYFHHSLILYEQASPAAGSSRSQHHSGMVEDTGCSFQQVASASGMRYFGIRVHCCTEMIAEQVRNRRMDCALAHTGLVWPLPLRDGNR